MKFRVPNYSCLQNLTRGLLPPDPPSLCHQLNLLNNPPQTKFLDTPLQEDTYWSMLKTKATGDPVSSLKNIQSTQWHIADDCRLKHGNAFTLSQNGD